MTGTPTNRLSNLNPPESGKRSPRANKPSGKGSRKQPPHDELPPLVVGQALSDDGLDTRLVKTEPDAIPSEPPVVMGLPLRDSKPGSFKGGGRRSEPEEPPTSIVNTAAPPSKEKEDSPNTPIVRSPLGASREAPASASASARPSAPSYEEPPAPTPIVPMKPPGGRRSEPETRRPPAAVPSPSTGTRPALQESPPAAPVTSPRPAEEEAPPAIPSPSPRAAPPEPPLVSPPTSSRVALQESPPVSPSTSTRPALQEPARGRRSPTRRGLPCLL